MSGQRVALIAGLGCVLLTLLLVMIIAVGCVAANQLGQVMSAGQGPLGLEEPAPQAIPTLPAAVPQTEREPVPQTRPLGQAPGVDSSALTELYKQANPGVVNIQVILSRGILSGSGAGSGFILDNEGHIVTNNHVVADAEQVIVVFYNGYEAEAEVIGTDADSDLAVVKVAELAEGAHPLPLGDSDRVEPGEWVVAIGNPFQLGGSMTVGIVSAVGRTIPSGATPFSIPQAVQTDAAINPGNSGGPLLNLRGEVIGVNAQIQTRGGVRANAGVGFAIPSNIVRRVVPVLIEKGSYEWPWLGVRGGDVSLAIMKANNLDTQQGAYISEVVPGSPADEAGLRGALSAEEVYGLPVPVGGDVVIAADGKPIADFSDLLVTVAFKNPGDKMELTILRGGRRQQVTVTLAPRPETLEP